MNSIKQTKAAIYPVLMAPLLDGMEQSDVPRESMQGDVLWCTEMERCVRVYMCVLCYVFTEGCAQSYVPLEYIKTYYSTDMLLSSTGSLGSLITTQMWPT